MTDDPGHYPLDRQRVLESIRTRKLVTETWHNKWHICCYVGPSLNIPPEGIEDLQFTGIALNDVFDESSIKPDLETCDTAMHVVFGNKATVLWSAKTRSLLTRKIKQTFRGFDWRTFNDGK